MVIRLLLPLLLVVFWTGAADARMYRWVDENGTTVYSQSPPPSGKATEIKVQTATPTPPDNAPATQAESETQAAPEKTASGPSKEQIEESNRIKKENCAAARKNLDIYTNLGNRLIRTPDGLYQRLTEEERQEKIKESQAQIDEFCQD